MSEIGEILDKVERLRGRLETFAAIKALTDPEVLALSQLLDQALNEYSAKVNIQGKDLTAASAKYNHQD